MVLRRVSQRTIFWFNATMGNKPMPRSKKTFRNPIIQAKEMKLGMELINLSRAELARELGISRAGVAQFLSLLKLREELKEEIEAMRDHWGRRLVRKRALRRRKEYF